MPKPEFLTMLREETKRHGIVLIFDEIVSFRVARGGAQELVGITPDLTTLGKVIAGGMPGGAFGGKSEIMALFDPKSPTKIPQSGTFNAAPIVMAAGLAQLEAMTPEVYATLEKRAKFMADGLTELFKKHGVVASVIQVGSIFQYFFLPKLPSNYRESGSDDKAKHEYI